MTTTIKTSQEFYDEYKDEVQALAPDFTDFSDGSLHDINTGALTIGMNEITELIISEFAKTFFNLAEGSDLDTLAVDHFGDAFARPLAVFATGAVTFSRPNNAAGDILIPAGTIVKTLKDAQGTEIRFATEVAATITGTSISVAAKAVIAGVAGNAGVGKITVIESTLLDYSITVNNPLVFAGGKETLTDAEYREYLEEKLLSLAGATDAAVRAAAKTVPGVSFVALITRERIVIDYDIALDQILSGATFFRIPYPELYIADAAGNSSQALIDAVGSAVLFVRGCGVKVKIKGAVALPVNWRASVTLNVSGPNYSTLQSDLSVIIDTMTAYINESLDIGSGFDKVAANAHVMSIWGPAGTNDLTAFTTSIPGGNVSAAANQKLIAGTVEIV